MAIPAQLWKAGAERVTPAYSNTPEPLARLAADLEDHPDTKRLNGGYIYRIPQEDLTHPLMVIGSNPTTHIIGGAFIRWKGTWGRPAIWWCRLCGGNQAIHVTLHHAIAAQTRLCRVCERLADHRGR